MLQHLNNHSSFTKATTLSKAKISLSQATEGFFASCRAARYSEHTLTDYKNTFRKFEKIVAGDTLVNSIGVDEIVRFMGSPDVMRVSKKTALNYHTGLSSLWRWSVEKGYCETNIVRLVKAPRPEQRDIIPYTQNEVRKLLNAANNSRLPERDFAIVLTLLDTGMRASELCDIKIKKVYFEERQILVLGKGGKERRLRVSQDTIGIIRHYLNSRGCSKLSTCREQYLFLGSSNKKITRHTLRLLCNRLEVRANVAHVYAHKFRHTFAIEFLRNGGNIFTLQKLLGHTTLDMVKRYLAIVQSDIDRDHDVASPVKNWHLVKHL